MRYDEPIFFQEVQRGQYNAATGDYEDGAILETMRRASVTDSGAETMNLIYGTIKQGSKTIRLQRPYREIFDRIRIGSKIYRVDFARQLESKHVFVVSEVQTNGNT